MSKLENLIGNKYGRLTVIERSHNIGGKTAWICECDCGKRTIVKADNLKRGMTKSCGCYANEMRVIQGHNNAKHGGFGTRIYRIYRGMYQRCYDKNISQYPRYGGRGIEICEQWLGDSGFSNFRLWAYENGYNDNLTIDRIDVNGNYEPSNCRWATNKTQMNNRRNCVYLTHNGKTHTLSEWAEIIGVNVSTIKSRYRSGWSDSDILTRKIQTRL